MVHGERRHRDGILSAARKLIYARGYADVGVAEICADAGVKKSSFCPFFPSQRDPILAVLESALADLKSDLLDRAFAADVSPLQRLRRFVELTTRFQAQRFNETGTVPGCQFGNLAAERATQDEVLHDRVDAVFRRLAAVLSVTLDEAVHAGELDPIDPAPRAAAMLAYVEGMMLMAKARNDPVVLAQLLPAMPDIRIEPARDGAGSHPAPVERPLAGPMTRFPICCLTSPPTGISAWPKAPSARGKAGCHWPNAQIPGRIARNDIPDPDIGTGGRYSGLASRLNRFRTARAGSRPS